MTIDGQPAEACWLVLTRDQMNLGAEREKTRA
jgi:hypothetical protein